MIFKGKQVLDIVSFFIHINTEKLSSVVQMILKKYKITKGPNLFPLRPNFSAVLSGKFCPGLATPKYIFALNLTERICLLNGGLL
jgi:hypothetical protein